jgi:uncharacterized protein Yka (UPF0111/DUF47 family)
VRRNRAHRREVRCGHVQAIKSLFDREGDDAAALRAMRMRQFYSLQEKVLRASKKSAQTLEEILLQNA